MYKILSIFLIIMILTSCNRSGLNFVPDGEVIVSGTIINYKKHTDLKSFNLYYHNLFNMQNIKSVSINNDGSFKTSIPCHYNMDFFIGIGRTPSYLICSPNDSLFLTIDADILNNPQNHFPNDSYFVKVVGGTRINDNRYVNDFLQKVTRYKLSRNEYLNLIKTSTPTEYISYQDTRYKLEMNVLDSISDLPDTSLFKLWAKDFSKFEKIDKLLKYPKIKARECNSDIDSIFLPENYYNNIFNKGINNNDIFSFYHSVFFDAYFVYLYKKAKRKKTDVLDFICDNTNGFSKDLILSRYFISVSKESDSLTKVNFELIENSCIKRLLKAEIDKNNKKKKELLNLKANSTIIDSLFSKYKGKVVYVDFWATWCSPCLKEMPWSMKLQKTFENRPIVFLYLCNQSSYENWQKTIKSQKINGEHILLNYKQFNELKALFDIKGIPHYILINKEGGFINYAPRPSSKEIVMEIKKLLME